MKHTLRHLARAAACAGLVLLLPLDAAASKPQPIVVGSWQGAPASVPLGRTFTIVLRLTASRDASDVTVEVLSTPGVEVTSGDRRWTGSLTARNARDLSFSIRVVANGDWTLGARITNKHKEGDQVSGAVLTIAAKDGVATLSTDPAKAWAALTPEERQRLGIAVEAPQPTPARRPQPRRKSPPAQ